MNGGLPEIYWYVFWVGVVIISFCAAYLAGRSAHQIRLKALDILKMYAERGAEPPQAVMEQLARQVFESQNSTSTKQTGRDALIRGFIGFVFVACASGALHYWLTDSGAASWAVFASQGVMAFFGFGAFGLLLAALLTREK